MRPKGEDDAFTILLDPSRVRADFGWEPKTPLGEGVRRAIDYYRERGIEQTFTHLRGSRTPSWRPLSRARRGTAHPRRGRRRLRGLEPGPRAARRRAARGPRGRQPAVGGAGEPARRRARAPDRGLDQRRRGARRRCPRDLDYVFHLSTYHGNQSSMADPLADHEHNTLTTPEAVRGAQGSRRGSSASSTPRRAARSPRRPSRAPRPRRRTRRSRSGSTARTRSPRSSASTTPTTTSRASACRSSRRASRTSTGPARCWAPAAGAARSTRSGATSRPTFIYKALQHEALPVENGGIASRDFIYVDDMARGPDRVRHARRAGRASTTSPAARRRRSASWPS